MNHVTIKLAHTLSACAVIAGLAACGNSSDTATTSPPVQASASPSPVAAAPAPPSAPDCTKLKCVALTYDDGPGEYTPQLLDTLEREKATATLFVLGQYVPLHPEIVKRADAMGIEIASHSTNHKLLNKQSAAVVDKEIKDTQDRIHEVLGKYPTVMRPPYAGHNSTVDSIAGKYGLSVVTWNACPVDWVNKDAKVVASKTIAEATAGSIVLLHDSHKWSVDATPEIIKGLRAKGLTLVTVSQILGTPKPGEVYTKGIGADAASGTGQAGNVAY